MRMFNIVAPGGTFHFCQSFLSHLTFFVWRPNDIMWLPHFYQQYLLPNELEFEGHESPHWSGRDRRQRMVLSVLNGPSVLFYHCRLGLAALDQAEVPHGKKWPFLSIISIIPSHQTILPDIKEGKWLSHPFSSLVADHKCSTPVEVWQNGLLPSSSKRTLLVRKFVFLTFFYTNLQI